jgi:hypothetical protein
MVQGFLGPYLGLYKLELKGLVAKRALEFQSGFLYNFH